MIFVGGDGPGLDGGKAPESEPKPFGMEEGGGGGGGKARLWLRGCSRDGLGGGELLETEKTVRMRAPHHCRIQEEDRGRAGEGGGGLAGTVGAFWPAGELKRCRQRDIRKSSSCASCGS